MAAIAATTTINTKGPLLINRLHNISERAREIALHGVHHGVGVALAAAQVQTGYDLVSMEPDFPIANDLDMYEGLIGEFGDTVAAMIDIILAQDIVNRVFD